MKIEVTAAPRAEDEAFVVAQTRAYNAGYMPQDSKRLCVFARDGNGAIIGGVTATTVWNFLDIAFLWVDNAHRKAGLASSLMAAAEAEAIARGCEFSKLDTFSFQALGFYQKLGYREFGRLEGYSGKQTRHYLVKSLRD